MITGLKTLGMSEGHTSEPTTVGRPGDHRPENTIARFLLRTFEKTIFGFKLPVLTIFFQE